MPFDESNLVCLGVRAAYEAAGKPVPTLKYHLKLDSVRRGVG